MVTRNKKRRMRIMNKEDYIKEYNAFYKKYPDCPQSEVIDSLSLIMKKENAEAIKRGKKSVEFREFKKYYGDKIFDKAVSEYIAANQTNPDLRQALEKGIVSSIKIVNNLHFHNYNNSWEMDVECISNGIISITPEDIHFLQERFNCHELDNMLSTYKNYGDEPPLLFYFACGKVTKAKNI
jgi:hypothetical protein